MRARVPTPRESNIAKLEDSKSIPKPYKLRNYYIPSEVAIHNTADNCWISFFNQVFDLTLLIHENKNNELCDPLILAAGTDITHWFDKNTREVTIYHPNC
jgi:cytochrome b involved in lipid metabolism